MISEISNRVILSNAKYLYITRWDQDQSEDGFKSPKTYDIKDIVGDSLSFTPDDNTVNSKESEFTNTPLFENITLGKIQFAANCIDFQNTIMKEIFGWSDAGKGSVAAPTVYKDVYVTIEVGFANENVVVVAPKLKLNSKAIISNMKTGSSEGNLAGTAYEEAVTIGEGPSAVTAPLLFIDSSQDKTYKIKTKTFTVGEGLTA